MFCKASKYIDFKYLQSRSFCSKTDCSIYFCIYDEQSHSVPSSSGFNTLYLFRNHPSWAKPLDQTLPTRDLLWMMNKHLKNKEGANVGVENSEEGYTHALCNVLNLLLCFFWNTCRLPPQIFLLANCFY